MPVLFDLDGTLADTSRDILDAVNVICKQHNKAKIKMDLLHPLINGGSRAMLGAALAITTEDHDFQRDRQELFAAYKKTNNMKSTLFPGIKELLQQLHTAKITWGIVTNKPLELAIVLVKKLKIDTHCACLIGADSTHPNKPSPEPLLLACEEIKSETKNTIYIGDAVTDIVAATAAGMQSIAVRYGFNNLTPPIEDWGATHIADSATDLMQYIKTHTKS